MRREREKLRMKDTIEEKKYDRQKKWSKKKVKL